MLISKMLNCFSLKRSNPFEIYAGYEYLTQWQMDELRAYAFNRNIPKTPANLNLLELIWRAYDY